MVSRIVLELLEAGVQQSTNNTGGTTQHAAAASHDDASRRPPGIDALIAAFVASCVVAAYNLVGNEVVRCLNDEIRNKVRDSSDKGFGYLTSSPAFPRFRGECCAASMLS